SIEHLMPTTSELVRTMSFGGSKRRGRAGIFVVGCALIVVVSGSWRVPAAVARGVGYYPPYVYASAASKGTIDLAQFDPWLAGPGDAGGGDDLGYAILRTVWVLAGGDGSLETVVELHNVFVLACAVAFAAGAALMTRSLLAGWVSLALALVLRYLLRGLLSGAADNRTLIVFFPLAFILLVILVGPATRRIHRPAGILASLGTGGVIGMADLVRHSEGLLAFYGMVLACLLVKASLWRRFASIALVVLGSVVVTHAVPMGVRLFNDTQTGRSEGTLLSSVRPLRPSYHSAWHSLQISLGRYPNPEGLCYNDLIGFTA